MGVDYYACRNCGETFCDCGDYISCECGEHWCDDDCAKADGFTRESCNLGYDCDDNECENSCYRCKNHLDSSCNYCREEDFEDLTLLDYALKLLTKTRYELISEYKNNKE